jgi:holo-[acyl-carrier protein] synthase
VTRVGIDLVSVQRIAGSLDEFGDRFMTKLFTADEIAYAVAAPDLTAQRLAARFAAKEAAIKALGLGGDRPLDWREIEVRRAADGALALALHGAAREHAAALGVDDVAISFSHEGDLATAIVIATTKREHV